MPRKKQISEKQLAANRANAQRSTGPRSEAGRKIVSLNAVKHGLAGHTAVLPGEDRAAHEAFCGEIVAEFAPASAIELNLAQSIAGGLWRLDRARAVEDNMFAVGQIDDDPDPDHDPAMQMALAGARTFLNHANKFGLLSLYEQRINRSVHRNLAEMRRTQGERRQPEQAASERVIATRQPIPIDSLRACAAVAPDTNGFVYANNNFDAGHDPRRGLSLVAA